MLWDVFCRVIDNFGDIGVCWRLCADLAGRGHTVRLWTDDASPLAWMAPIADRPQAIQVLSWDAPPHEPGDVVIEAFGCNPPDAFVARMQRPLPPVWLNLEYLSAEAWVERCHGLRSPVMSGPGTGLSKWFCYPGFTAATAGLLREPGLLTARAAWGEAARAGWLAAQGIAPLSSGERLISLFCYAAAPVSDLLDTLRASGRRIRLLATPGFATQSTQAWLARCRPGLADSLTVHHLPHLSQPDFDRLLWTSDLNFVRGEDSAVRALWGAQAHIWHIYPQDDGVHADKLDAFLDRWTAGWPDDLAAQVRELHRAWNGLQGGPAPPDLRAIHALLDDDRWAPSSRASRAALIEIPDLVTQLCGFVAEKR